MIGGLISDLVADGSRKKAPRKRTKPQPRASGQQTTKKKPADYDEAEEKRLENVVFGAESELLTKIDRRVDLVAVNVADCVGDNEQEIENELFVVDRVGDNRNFVPDHQHQSTEQTTVTSADEESVAEVAEKVEDVQVEAADATAKPPAWEDEDDQIMAAEGFDGCARLPKLVQSDDHYRQYLERKFTEIYQPPEWATKALEQKKQKRKRREEDDESSSDDDENMERTARDYRRKSDKHPGQLSKDFLQLKKCTALNHQSRVRTAVQVVQFHPNATVAMLASKIGLVRLFQVDGKTNAPIQSVYFRNYHLSDARFLSAAGREEIIVGSSGQDRHSSGFCFYYDMMAGKIVRIKLGKSSRSRFSLRGFQLSPDGRYLAACDQNGQINLLTTGTKELVAELKHNGDVDCLAFDATGGYLISHGRNSGCQAYVWDVRNLSRGQSVQCVNRFTDQGTVEATRLAASAQLLATGSNMGVVNLYRIEDIVRRPAPDPVRTVMNLTTSISALRFNHDGQLLLIASDQKNDAIRFVNTTAGTVYKNFPLFVGGPNRQTYGRIYDVDFSPNSGYASFVSGNGTGHLFRINEYPSY